MATPTGSLIVISGPSGSGKGSLIGDLLACRPDLRLAVSATTRRPRAGEQDGRDYRFLTPAEFARREQAGEFLETVTYAGNRYGTLVSELEAGAGEGIVVEIEPRGATTLRARLPHARLIFIAPPSLDELALRLRGRGSEDEPAIARRLETARVEMAMADLYDALIVNDQRARASAQLIATVAALSAPEPALA